MGYHIDAPSLIIELACDVHIPPWGNKRTKPLNEDIDDNLFSLKHWFVFSEFSHCYTKEIGSFRVARRVDIMAIAAV